MAPNSWMDVPIRPVSQRTNRIKLPRMIMSGTRTRLNIRNTIKPKNSSDKADAAIMNGNTLFEKYDVRDIYMYGM